MLEKSKNKIIIDETGIADQESINLVLKSVKNVLKKTFFEVKTNKRVYAAAVECLDNVLKHSEEINDDPGFNGYPSRFYMKDTGKSIVLYAGNIILNSNIEKLIKRFEILDDLKPANLNQLYKKKLLTAEISDKGGAGLGLIIIAKISGKRIKYDFEKINNKFSYFALQIEFNYIN